MVAGGGTPRPMRGLKIGLYDGQRLGERVAQSQAIVDAETRLRNVLESARWVVSRIETELAADTQEGGKSHADDGR